MKTRLIQLAAKIITACICIGAANAATITVNTADNTDLGAGKTNLVRAISLLADGDTINFNIPNTTTNKHYLVTPPRVPNNGYPPITNNNVTIDGYSQPGASPNTNSILAANNAQIRIVLDSTGDAGNVQDINGYGLRESATLFVTHGTNVHIKGLCFLGPGPTVGGGTSGTVDDPSRYAISFGLNADYGHVSGCRIGLDLDGTTVHRFKDAVTVFGDSGIAPSRTSIGVKPGPADATAARAQFNVLIGAFISLIFEGGTNYNVSGNFLNVYPNGVTDYTSDGNAPHNIESFIENGGSLNGVIGTDGDGLNDAEERNIFGGVTAANDDNILEFYGGGTVNLKIAGNYFGIGVDGTTRFSNSMTIVDNFKSGATAQFGSDFDGISDDLEGNVIYMNNPFAVLFPDPPTAIAPPPFSFFDAGARVSFRGNKLINNNLAPFSYADGLGGKLPAFTNYAAPFMDVTSVNGLIPILATTNIYPSLGGTFAPGLAPYTNITIDVYQLDPESWANGKLFVETELTDNATFTNGFPQGKKYLGTFAVSNTGSFSINVAGLDFDAGTVIVTANYSADPMGTHNGRTHTSDFSTPVYVFPGALGSVGLTHVVPDVALWYNSANYFTNGPVNPAAQVTSLATWEPYIGLLGDSTFLFIANTFVDDGTAQNMRPALAFQPAAGGPARLGAMFYDDSGHAYTNKHHEFSPPQAGDLGRVGGDTRYGANNFMGGVAVAFYNYPSFFNSDGRFDASNPFYSTLAAANGRDACVQSYSLNPVTLAQTPLSKALDSAFGRCCTNASYPASAQNQLSRLQHVLGLSDGNFVSVVEDRSQLNNPAGNAAVATVFRPNGSIVKEAFKVADGDQWSNVAAFRGGFCVRASGVLYFFDNLGNLQGSVNQSTSGLPFGTNRGDETRIASDIRSYYVYLAGRTPDSSHAPVSVAIWDSRTRVFVTSATVSDTDPIIHDANRVNLAVDALDRFCVAYSLKPTADFLQYQVAARVMAFNGTGITYLTHSFFPFVNYDPSGGLGLMTDNPGVAMTTRQICISGNGTINSTNNPAAGPDTSSMTDVYTVISHPTPVAAPKPTMTITKSGGNVVVDWNVEDGLFTVQTKPSVGPGAWSNATAGNVAPPVTLPIGAGAQLIRLAR